LARFRSGPLPVDFDMGTTLAQRVSKLRDYRNLTVKDLAKNCRFAVERIEDLEAGLETWLSASDRQRLAKALNIEANVLQEVEMRAVLSSTKESKEYTVDRIREIAHAIINGARDLECPECGGNLKCSIQQGLDLENNVILLARAFCSKCPFVVHG
jgi:transcriptional regulator with XRE-family HTH domain